MSQITDEPLASYLDAEHSYYRKVFLTPPWPEIYVTDADRKHELTKALEEYDRLLEVYPSLGYEALVVPKASVEARAEFMLAQLVR